MPRRLIPFITGEYYHLFNRGVEKRDLYLQPRDYQRFQQTFYYYQYLGPKPKFSKFTKSSLFKPILNERLVEILCYCMMPNHFHFLIKQLKENGISKFIGQLCNSYTKYFNTKNSRTGPLFQGAFKAVRIETDEQLIHTSRYIHLNPIVSGLVKNLTTYKWSSFHEYTQSQPFFSLPGEILNFFPSAESYQMFVEDQIDYGITLEILKHRSLDVEDK